MLLRIGARDVPYATVMTVRTRLIDKTGVRIMMSDDVVAGNIYVQLDDEHAARVLKASLEQLDGADIAAVNSVPASVEWTEDPTPPTRVLIRMESRP